MTTATATKVRYYAIATRNGMPDVRYTDRRQALAFAKTYGYAVSAHYADGSIKFL
jgi:hypothetical protein